MNFAKANKAWEKKVSNKGGKNKIGKGNKRENATNANNAGKGERKIIELHLEENCLKSKNLWGTVFKLFVWLGFCFFSTIFIRAAVFMSMFPVRNYSYIDVILGVVISNTKSYFPSWRQLFSFLDISHAGSLFQTIFISNNFFLDRQFFLEFPPI